MKLGTWVHAALSSAYLTAVLTAAFLIVESLISWAEDRRRDRLMHYLREIGSVVSAHRTQRLVQVVRRVLWPDAEPRGGRHAADPWRVLVESVERAKRSFHGDMVQVERWVRRLAGLNVALIMVQAAATFVLGYDMVRSAPSLAGAASASSATRVLLSAPPAQMLSLLVTAADTFLKAYYRWTAGLRWQAERRLLEEGFARVLGLPAEAALASPVPGAARAALAISGLLLLALVRVASGW